MRVGLDRGTRGGRAESWAVYMVQGRERVHGDEDGVSQVGEDNGELSRRPVRRVHANTTRRRQGSAGDRTCVDIDGLIGLASKPGSQSRCAVAWGDMIDQSKP